MHDQGLVSVLHAVAHAQEQAQARRQVECVAAREVGDRFAVDVLHHEVGRAGLVDAAVDQARDVGVLELGEDLAFLAETPHQPWRRPGELLDRHALLELAVAALGQPHFAHAADAECTHDAPIAEALRWCRRLGGLRGGRADHSGRLLHEAGCLRIRTQQPVHFDTQVVVARAGDGKPGVAFRRRQVERLFEYFGDAPAVHRAQRSGCRTA